jgi:N-acetylmuramoyl-L-alanine amidase
MELRYAVVLDAAHGGTDLGAQLSASLDEKAYVLALTRQLHALLNARSIPVILTRDADVPISGDQRAQSMNHAHAAACLSVHATTVGNGVHLFTSSLPPSAASGGQRSFVPWKTAQAGYITQSLRLESELNTALSQAQIPVLMGRTTLMPLESATCPAVAIEIAPLNANTPVTDQKYQQQIIDALAAALTQWRTDWRMQP